ncbi:insulinase family protein [Porticoccus sp. W117]|uniref:insulinase family protein n=1 Tax=Porticoccus sp. W117 TaxID=3054777 RepID=UPI00259424EE|nr:insulinase family protein [Porticoccus sp. W117]MDM3872005.1 insulinase family protein [Porticoccus sp. W117]
MSHHPKCDPAFEFLRSEAVESLNLTIEEYRHTVTGAQHIHLASDNTENVFLVALRTVPTDSTGVAHILEHTALCGSEKYPVRDPFFMMIRRSLNTFMNAFTSSDWTAYPFASQNLKDFNNLLDVYLDAVFFSRLDELDFAQEGHRVEFAEADNPDSPLVYKGVVFNEMKGAMSSVPSTLWHALCKYLYPTTTYHHNSGGEPECIPDLSYQQLRDFYKTHYHPSNAIFMTFGDIPAVDHQQKFQQQALHRFEKLDEHIAVADEKRYQEPLQVEEAYALTEEGDLNNKTHVVLGWLLGKATDLQASMEANLLCSVLLDNSASPLQKALETSNLGTAPSPLCGLDDSQRELCFVCGLEGSDPDKEGAVEQMILDVLQDVAENGVPYEQVAASLHQLELQQREIGGDSYPYGLQLILTALTSATHRGDPIALLNLDPVLNYLRGAIQNPDFIKDLARNLLLENRHRVRLTLRPDQQMAERKDAAEAARLAAIKAGLSDQEKQQIVERAHALEQRQHQVDDASILPKVGRDDIPQDMAYVETTHSDHAITSYAAGTNGLVYQQIVMPLPQLTDEQLDLLPIYTTCLTELGCGEQDYLQTQLHQSQVCGSISAYVTARGTPDDVQQLNGYLTLSAKGLGSNQQAITELMNTTLTQVRFDELPRIRELVAQSRARREMGVTGSGHQLAMTAASSGIGPGALLAHRWGGMRGIQLIKQLDDKLNSKQELEALAQQLQNIHQQMLSAERKLLLVADADQLHDYQRHFSVASALPENDDFLPFGQPAIREQRRQCWTTSTQVNFCAKAYPTVAMDHPDSPALTVLGGFLRNGYLHRAIREQGGAYGGGAGQDNHIGAFRFFSYRDPRIEGTLADFDASLAWLHDEQHSEEQLEEAVLGVISAIDKPGSPAGEAKQTYHAELYGRSREKREQFRNRILQVTLDDLKRVAATYLVEEQASVAVITSPDKAALLGELYLEQIAL